VNHTQHGRHFYSYDGNGNVCGITSATDGTRTGGYEYDPFGGVIRVDAANPVMSWNEWRFSSKRKDPVAKVVLYEYRGCDANTGRWLNRDPIGEEGGVGLVIVTSNYPTGFVDPLGLKDEPKYPPFDSPLAPCTVSILIGHNSTVLDFVNQTKKQYQNAGQCATLSGIACKQPGTGGDINNAIKKGGVTTIEGFPELPALVSVPKDPAWQLQNGNGQEGAWLTTLTKPDCLTISDEEWNSLKPKAKFSHISRCALISAVNSARGLCSACACGSVTVIVRVFNQKVINHTTVKEAMGLSRDFNEFDKWFDSTLTLRCKDLLEPKQ
jgi:RHS repeat-associated protein